MKHDRYSYVLVDKKYMRCCVKQFVLHFLKILYKLFEIYFSKIIQINEILESAFSSHTIT